MPLFDVLQDNLRGHFTHCSQLLKYRRVLSRKTWKVYVQTEKMRLVRYRGPCCKLWPRREKTRTRNIETDRKTRLERFLLYLYWGDIWNVSYIELRIWNQVSYDHHSNECNSSNCVHCCDDHSSPYFKSAVQYMKHFICHLTPILHGLIRTHKWPAPNVSGFITQLLRASHRYREVRGWNPVEVLTFSSFYERLLKLRSSLRWS